MPSGRIFLQDAAILSADIVFGTDELRDAIFDVALDVGPAAVVMRRFGRISCVCKQWQQELWGRSQRLLVLLAKLSAESALPTVRLAAALSCRNLPFVQSTIHRHRLCKNPN